MTPWAEQAITFGKAVILHFHRRNEEESEDDSVYIACLKTVIQGMVSTAPDPLSRRQAQQALYDYARELYVQMWFDIDDDDDQPNLEEALDTFESLYETGRWPD
ncbi:MAG: hypothetical protein B0D91_03785 [Oceanospirillales bacterium LUC14_002_19_P2]|nr:MAG: hypothetical protein B0D91_03785 [Oceanospirillales bacterium LUC14_002_19_P2]